MEAGSTIDNSEKERFNQLAKTWWDNSGPMWPLHLLNQFRIQNILSVLEKHNRINTTNNLPLKGLNVLDVGCGAGILSETLCKLGAKVTGIDIAENSIQIAKQHASNNNLDITYTVSEASQVQGRYDIVFNMEVIEHVVNIDQFISNCSTLLRPNGIMFVATINRTFKSYLFAIIGAEYVLRLLPKGTHQWGKFVKPLELNNLLLENRLEPFWSTGLSLNPFNKKFSAQKSLAINYMIAAQKGSAL